MRRNTAGETDGLWPLLWPTGRCIV